MKRKIISASIFVVLLMIIIFGTMTVLFLITRESPVDYNHVYIVDVDRTSDDYMGLESIDTAERIDYEDILEVEPLDDSSVYPLKPTESRANYISKENLDHYTDHINELEKDHTFGQYKLDYTASSDKVMEIQLRFRARTDFYGQSPGLYFNGRYIGFHEGAASNFIYHNGTDLEVSSVSSAYSMDEELVISYYNCYIIEMRLYYSTKQKPDEGGGFEMFQYVVIDNDGELKFFYNIRYDKGVLEDWLDAPW
jgi:hypothetical protein